MLAIKLYPKGKKHQRTYRIVVSEKRSKANGNFVADLGFYNPQTKTVNINQPQYDQWLKNGAQATRGVDKLLHPEKYPKTIKKKTLVKPEPITTP